MPCGIGFDSIIVGLDISFEMISNRSVGEAPLCRQFARLNVQIHILLTHTMRK